MITPTSNYGFPPNLPTQHGSLSCPKDRERSSPSDWSMLNSLTAARLRRYLQKTEDLTAEKIERACHLLEIYHTVYRHDLLLLRRQGYCGKCPPPTSQQLQQMAQRLTDAEGQIYSTEYILLELKTLARYLKTQK